MKKWITLCLTIIICIPLVSCSITTVETVCSHEWADANCQTPKTCSLCGITEGTASPTHTYVGDECIYCGLTQLTLYNYKNFLDCNATVAADDTTYVSGYGYVYNNVECSYEVTGNTHYKYNDVSITIKFLHYGGRQEYMQYLKNQLATAKGDPVTTEVSPCDVATCIVKLNLAGNGSDSCRLYTNWAGDYLWYSDFKNVSNGTMYEVVSVSGTVEEY